MDVRIRGRQLPPEHEPGETDLVVERWKQKVAAEGVPVTIFVREPRPRSFTLQVDGQVFRLAGMTTWRLVRSGICVLLEVATLVYEEKTESVLPKATGVLL